MCVYIYIYTHTYIHIHIHIHLHIHIHMHIHIHIHIYTYSPSLSLYIYIYIHIHMISVSISLSLSLYIYIYILYAYCVIRNTKLPVALLVLSLLVLLRGVGTQRHVFPPDASVQWQPDGWKIHTKKWFLGAGFLGAPPISLISVDLETENLVQNDALAKAAIWKAGQRKRTSAAPNRRTGKRKATKTDGTKALSVEIRPVRLLRVWISKGLTQADS